MAKITFCPILFWLCFGGKNLKKTYNRDSGSIPAYVTRFVGWCRRKNNVRVLSVNVIPCAETLKWTGTVFA